MPKIRSVEKRMWARVTKASGDGCWEWHSGKHPGRYGMFQVSPEVGPEAAHRVSWRMHNGDIPKGMVICHKCDNPPCVRPDHLFLGTYSDNTQDMIRKGRINTKWGLGKRRTTGGTGHCKLTAEDVRSMREMGDEGVARRKLRAMFGVSRSTVDYVLRRIIWKQVAD